jgi:phosphatidate cytidylyltransferase
MLLVPLSLLVMWWGGVAWSVIVGLVGIGLLAEWVQLCGTSPRAPLGALLVLVSALGWGLAIFGPPLPLLQFGLGALLLMLLLARPWLGFGVLYVGVSVWALIWLRQQAEGFDNLLFLLPVVWASDIGAYVAGRVVGGPKLAPAISPGKTWSGALGGVVAACLVGATIAGGLAGHPSRAALLASLLAVVSQIGDLGESYLKRRFGVKDSGRLIPGHGGLLDRLDGVLAASLAAVGWAFVAGPGQYLWR